MSCYNAARWLDMAIASVLNQTFSDFEFIVIDDGSVDKTLEVIQRYAVQDPRIVVIAKPNSGLSDSLNVGIERARGEWIARLDADDICEPTRLQKQFELSLANPSLVFIGTGLTIIDGDGKKFKTHLYPRSHTALLRNLTTGRKFPPHSSAFYSTKAVKSVGGYRNRLMRAEDWDLWLRLSEVGELSALSEPLLQIRKHVDQISHTEGGSRQVLDSKMATIAYLVRRLKFPDPLINDQAGFELFEGWVRTRLEEVGFLATQLHVIRLRACFEAIRFPHGILKLTGTFLGKPCHTFRFFQQRIAGESISRSLAEEWIKISKAS